MLVPKLKYEHVHITAFSKIRVFYEGRCYIETHSHITVLAQVTTSQLTSQDLTPFEDVIRDIEWPQFRDVIKRDFQLRHSGLGTNILKGLKSDMKKYC